MRLYVDLYECNECRSQEIVGNFQNNTNPNVSNFFFFVQKKRRENKEEIGYLR